ncbi:MAG: hypothetical protein JRI59_08020, partial [Deltaproteobacteria bacterium]|nr:hypothetical protein [Deltaproteobacteria bacterium]
LKEANSWLEENRDVVARELREGWAEIKPTVQSILDIMWAMVQAGAVLAKVLSSIAGALGRTSEAMKVEGALTGGIWDLDEAAIKAQKDIEKLDRQMAGLSRYEGGFLAGAGLPEAAPLAKRPTRSGEGAARAGTDTLKELREETARLAKELQGQWLETWKVMEESFGLRAKLAEEFQKREGEALKWVAGVWEGLLDAENLTNKERLKAQKEFIKARLKLIDQEIAEIRKKYGALVPEEVLKAYKKEQLLDLEKGLGKHAKEPKWVKDLSGMLSHAVSRGLVGLLRGEKTDFKELGIWMAEGLLERGVDTVVEMGVQFVASALGLVPPMIAGATTSGAILTASGAALAGQMIAGATAAAAILSAASFGLFHEGGIVMHQGGLVPPVKAHAGLALAPDERLVIAQTGEGILPRRTMAKLGLANFERLRRGDFQVGGGEYYQVAVTQHFHHRLTQREADRAANLLIKALDKKLAKRGRRLGG